jgi:hypothetical protein
MRRCGWIDQMGKQEGLGCQEVLVAALRKEVGDIPSLKQTPRGGAFHRRYSEVKRGGCQTHLELAPHSQSNNSKTTRGVERQRSTNKFPFQLFSYLKIRRSNKPALYMVSSLPNFYQRPANQPRRMRTKITTLHVKSGVANPSHSRNG